MAHEIERKFLVDRRAWTPHHPGIHLMQGYLSTDPDRTVRVRIAGADATLTIKGRTTGVTRIEFEYPIPLGDAEQLLALCPAPVIDKHRYHETVAGHVWEVDVFHGANNGLVLAEIELAAEDEAFTRPPWVAEEVSDDPRYYNANLLAAPFTTWGT